MDNWPPAIDPDPAEFPNTIKRRRTSTAPSDSMEGPPPKTDGQQPPVSPSSKSQIPTANDSVVGDVDTCRICRGEGSPAEPLFYPCKCSGSIKYVHQDCLMEWLSHSQKKHCELCKTPFRFTKLYAPDMPKSLPFYVFVSHMAKYLFRNVLVWLRATLVVSVWLGWLPYLMRSVWSFLFWISDEGFGGPGLPTSLEAVRNLTIAQRNLIASSVNSQGLATTTCPSGPLFPATTTAASRGDIAEQIPRLLKALGISSQPLANSSNTFVSAISRIVFGGASLASEGSFEPPSNLTSAVQTGVSARQYPYSSLLSEVGFLKNLTRNAGVNRTVIAVLEGQIITVLVIVCFILIILVRDYVVQQQPEINMRAAFAAQENNAPPAPMMPPPPHHHHHGQELEVDDGDEEDDENEAGDDESVIAHYGERDDERPGGGPQQNGTGEPRDPQQRPIAPFRRRLARQNIPGELEGTTPLQDAAAAAGPSLDQRLDQRAIQQQLDEATQVSQYLRIWREADGDREKVLRMIREEGLEERLESYVSATLSTGRSTASTTPGESPQGPGPAPYVFAGPAAPSQTPDEDDDVKGKRKATEDPEESLAERSAPSWYAQDSGEPLFQPSSPSRPRAISDGAQNHNTVNPLANNTWSFMNLPQESTTTDRDEREHTSSGSGQITPSSGSSVANSDIPDQHPTANDPSARTFGHNEAHVVPLNLAHRTGPEEPLTVAEAGDVDDHETPNGSADRLLPGDLQQVPGTAAQQPGGFVNRVADFMWRDIEDVDDVDALEPDAVELFLDDQDAPFVEANHGDDQNMDPGPVELAPDVVEAAAAAGLDPEALEDAEDFEGIMELIGMRGPIAGLFQNAIFCAFLVSMTIFFGIFIPYNIGRIAVWIVANPSRLLRIVFSFSKFIQDVVLFLVGFTMTAVLDLVNLMRALWKIDQGREFLRSAATDARVLTNSSFDRLADIFAGDTPWISPSEMRNFSAISHHALIDVKTQCHELLSACGTGLVYVLGGDYGAKLSAAKSALGAAAPEALGWLKNATAQIKQPNSWVINFNLPNNTAPVDPYLAFWGAKDRTYAILGGYIAMTFLAGLYLGRGTPFSSSQSAQEWEASIIDALNQASGVMKVILIISIEMLIFPLYCGLLLDFALLPLFEAASFKSRLLFTYNFPLTSIFVHWFVGTGYMFHFALFVSMCRKIMRKGVLYFIRDPDDPEFHPVRDVLERNVTTQLRKILFSAFVYGALVVVCLGGVVWGLSLALPHVLPIHYSSNEPVLEFPIDLLFYNFLMPLAVKFFKPSDGLHALYTWWFRRCARTLRLTWFLFGERRVDEEGILKLTEGEVADAAPWYRKLFLEVNKDNQVVPKTWRDMFEGGHAKPSSEIKMEEMRLLSQAKTKLVESGQIIPDGRFVRTPASDQVKIPKGQPVFFAVSPRNDRLDGKTELPESDLYSSTNYQFVYLPPHFRARVFLFILFIWMFAAVTGVGITIVPLVFGRRMFKVLIPAHIRTNDIYAFSIGIYILGGVGYFLFHARALLRRCRNWVAAKMAIATLLDRDALQRVAVVAKQSAKVGYTYTMLLLVFPLLATLLIELYILVPLHTWILYSSATGNSPQTAIKALTLGGHTIRVIQAWTLGLLYLKLGSRALLLHGGRPAQAVRAVLRRGWLEPDVAVLTRAFVIPGLLASMALVLLPPLATRVVVARGLLGSGQWDAETQVVAFRLAYPFAAACGFAGYVLRGVLVVLDGWRARVRDEAYLMGERLHNFGGLVGAGTTKGGAATAGEWRNGARL
ncbi:E3 ubiquitin-protein ligase march6 [Apiospora marii]|uniref:E3 ubiquitin-protein ligase march6 n=1 Tax=Apiospora marii TaxID=335849 RepID=UPI003131216A